MGEDVGGVRRRVVLVSYEYAFATFSGNGVLAASTARGLRDRFRDDVMVVCARPIEEEEEDARLGRRSDDDGERDDINEEKTKNMPDEERGTIVVVSVPVPKSKWGRLDKTCAHEEFAKNVSEKQLETVVTFGANHVLGVDWSSLELYKRIRKRYEDEETKSKIPPPPLTCLIYRVFTLHDESHRELEQSVVSAASRVICLCNNDAEFLRDAFLNVGEEAVAVEVIHPPLREDVLKDATNALAQEQPLVSSARDKKKRNGLTCVVRLSKEKEPERFVELVEELAKRNAFFSGNGGDGANDDNDGDALIPILVAPATSEFAEGLKKRFREATKNIPNASELCIESFLNAKQLGKIYSRTKLNVHPCRKDAYGMTVIEAAAFGAPSLVCSGGKVGSSELLVENEGVFSFDYDNETIEALANFITNIDENRLEEVSKIGRERALAYDEIEYAGLIAQRLMMPKECVKSIHGLADAYANALIAFSLDESGENVTILTRSTDKDNNDVDDKINSSNNYIISNNMEVEGWIITADNPHSMRTSIVANAKAKKALKRKLMETFSPVQLGRSMTSEYDSNNPDFGGMDWTERGYFIPFIGGETKSRISIEHLVLEIGRNFGQNAVYFIQRRSGENGFKVTVVSCTNDMEELRSTVEMIPRNIPEISRHMILANNDGDSDADDYE